MTTSFDEYFDYVKACLDLDDFRNQYPLIYDIAVSEGWIGDCIAYYGKKKAVEDFSYTVYAYEDIDNHSAYIGLTNCMRRRHYEHSVKDFYGHREDRLRLYFQKQNKAIPDPVIIYENLSWVDAQEKEEEVLHKYQDDGWNILNTGSVGRGKSSLGNTKMIWTKENCLKLKGTCKTRTEFMKKYPGAYSAIILHGWGDEILPPVRGRIKYTEEEALAVCKQYKNRDDFRNTNLELYEYMRERKYIDKVFPLQKVNLSKEDSWNILHEYGSLAELSKEHQDIEYYIHKQGWNKEFVERLRREVNVSPYNGYTFDECKNLCKKFNSRAKLLKNDYELYKYITKQGWLDEIVPKLEQHKVTLEEAKELAKGYTSRDKFRSNHYAAYYVIKNAGLLDELLPKVNYVYTPPKDKPEYAKADFDEYSKVASKYDSFADFIENEPFIYSKLKRKNWVQRAQKLFPEDKRKYQTHTAIAQSGPSLEDCIEVAKQCKTKKEFREKHSREYAAAQKYHLLKTFTWLAGCKKIFSEEECREKALLCSMQREFRTDYPRYYDQARANGWLKDYTWLKRKSKFDKN